METVALGDAPYVTALMRAVSVLQAGGVIVVPTDTVYGLLCDAANATALEKMFAIKHRPREKAFPIFVRDIAHARRYAYISDVKAKFLARVLPGPVTAVFHHKEKLSAALTGGRDTIGIRIPDHPFITVLLEKLAVPLAQTSANISDAAPARTAAEATAYFEKNPDRPDIIIDGGPVSGVSSTVIDCTGVSPLILRSGIISKADIDRMLGDA